MRSTNISVRFEFCVFVSILLFLMPLQLLISWLLAAFIHELFHYIALRLFRVDVYSLTIGFSGAVMTTGTMGVGEEIICSLAGPIGGLTLLLVARWVPYAALFGFIQSVFNLIPIYPLDGGRVLQCITMRFFKKSSSMICLVVKWFIIVFAGLVLIFLFHAWQVVIIALILYVLQGKVIKFPCKA